MTITLRLLGHASFKLKVNESVIIIDPYGGDDSEYEKADVILSTHKHGDHAHPDKIKLAQKDETIIITSTDNAANLKEKKIDKNVNIIDPGQSYTFGDIIFHGVPGYNFKRFRAPDVPFHPKEIQTAFVIEVAGKRIYFAGDTDNIEEMKDLKDIDYALLPIGGTYTMDHDDALEAIGYFNPKVVIPMHWRETDPEEFKKRAEKQYPGTSVKIILAGEELNL